MGLAFLATFPKIRADWIFVKEKKKKLLKVLFHFHPKSNFVMWCKNQVMVLKTVSFISQECIGLNIENIKQCEVHFALSAVARRHLLLAYLSNIKKET